MSKGFSLNLDPKRLGNDMMLGPSPRVNVYGLPTLNKPASERESLKQTYDRHREIIIGKKPISLAVEISPKP